MPICIECRYPVPQLYHVLHSTSSKPAVTSSTTANATLSPDPSTSAASSSSQKPSLNGTDIPPATRNVNAGLRGGGEAARKTRSSGADVRLTQCPRCKRFADKYVEHDFVVLFIDLVLVKPQVYRHLLINRLGGSSETKNPKFNPAIIRLAVLLTLFDVYITWSRIESLPESETAQSPVPRWAIPAQYLFFLVLSLASTVAQHVTVRTLIKLPFLRSEAPSQIFSPTPVPAGTPTTIPGTPSSSPMMYQNPMSPHMPPPQTPFPPASLASSLTAVAPPSGVSVSTALVVSSCMKLFPILMVVWKYDDVGGQLARGVKWAVAVQNLEALRILLGLAYWQAALVVLLGRVAEGVVEGVLLGFGGLGSVGVSWGLRFGVLNWLTWSESC